MAGSCKFKVKGFARKERKQRKSVTPPGNERPGWPGAYRWLATGTLMACTAVGMSKSAVAQSGSPALAPQVQASGLAVRRFDVPAGPVSAVLAGVEAATGLHIKLPEGDVRNLPSPGITGLSTVDAALRQVLAGTGLGFRYQPPDSITVDFLTVRSSVDVTAAGSALETTSPKYATPLLDTPQTVGVIPKETMEQQGATTLRDALRNVAGISLAAGEGGAQGDSLTIRGFTARNDLFIDGMRDFGSYYRDPFNTEEVEVLQGPSSVTFGRGSTGGVVNQATKSPQPGQFVHGSADIGTDLTRRFTLDLDRPLPKVNGAAWRLNLMGNEGDVAGRDVAKNRRFGVAPSLVFGLGTPTRWTFSYFHQGADDIPDYGLPWLFDGPAPVNRKNFYGFSEGNFLRTSVDIGTARVEHDFGGRFTIRNQVRFAGYDRDTRITEPRMPTGVTPATPLSSIIITRNQIAVDSTESLLNDQLDFSARFRTGFVQHTLIGGAEAGRETSDPVRTAWANVPTTSLLNPDPDQAFSGTSSISSNVHTTAKSVASYFLETMSLGKKLDISGGVRWDRFDTNYSQLIAPVSSFHRVDQMPTWRAAVVFKPIAAGSIYATTSTSFNPSAESLSLSASTANLPPEKNRNYEAGTKWDLHGRVSMSTAVFRTEKLNAREPDPNNSLLNVLAGTQRVNGVQAQARARLTRRWDMQASYAHLDAKVVGSTFYPAAVGARLANVPENTFSFWTNARLPWHMEGGFGGNYVSSRTSSATAPLDPVTGRVKQAPAYWLFSAMAKYPLAERLDLQVNVVNLANRFYYDQLHPAHIVPGAGRSALIGLQFKF